MTINELKLSFKTYHLPNHWLNDWLLFVIKKSPNFLITDSDYVLTDDELTQFLDGITKMQNGIPVNYLTNIAYFWGMEFFVNENCLIPRADTEILVEQAISLIQNFKKEVTILELGTGSGCISIALNKALEKLQLPHTITAVDKYQQALEIAQKNATILTANIRFIQSDWYSNIHNNFDIIISNPPYIASDDEHLKELIAEPITALTADNNGLSDIIHIIDNSRRHLTKNGIIILEHGYNQKTAVQAIFNQYGFDNITTIKDYGGNDRVSFGFFNP